MLLITHNILANWIAFELKSNKVIIIKQYISVLYNKHIDKDLPIIIFFELFITHIFTKIYHLYDTQSIHERLEIIKDILFQIFIYIDISSFNDLNIHISFYITFAKFLHSDKFTWDEWNHAKSLISHISR